jgi:hypothetical protein
VKQPKIKENKIKVKGARACDDIVGDMNWIYLSFCLGNGILS